MDVAVLAAFLAPFLPKLLGLGKQAAVKATEVAAGKAGEAAWQQAQALWAKLRPQVEAKPAAQEAAADAAENPDDGDYQAAFKVQLKKILAADAALAREIAAILASEDGAAAGDRINVQTSGDQSPAIGKVSGGGAANINYN